MQKIFTSIHKATILLLCTAYAAVAHAALVPESDVWKLWETSDETNPATIDHSDWQEILDVYLVADDPTGINRFRYAAVTTADRNHLQAYIDQLANTDPRDFNRSEQRAYWTNLYNALTVNLVVQYYPVKSIRKIEGGLFGLGPWDEELVEISGAKLTLNDIEHRILRPIFEDPRTHYAVNCASLGCPNLAKYAYTAANMESLLNEGARNFINSSRGVDISDSQLRLSSIYKWFSADFGANEAELIQHLRRYATPELAEQLANFSGRLKYGYDWSLNEP